MLDLFEIAISNMYTLNDANRIGTSHTLVTLRKAVARYGGKLFFGGAEQNKLAVLLCEEAVAYCSLSLIQTGLISKSSLGVCDMPLAVKYRPMILLV